jgi:AraC-like DNA-binding protein
MAYRELEPPAEIAAHVACLWVRDAEPVAREHRIVPDACADIVWISGRRLVVAGPATGPLLTTVPADGTAVGVRFRVGAAGGALGLPAREVLDAHHPLADVWGRDGAELTERLGDAPDADSVVATLIAALARRLPPDGGIDPLVRAAAIGAARPRTPIEAVRAGLGIGERQLRRRFDDAVGYGPKTLQRVLRFQRFLALARPAAGVSPTEAAAPDLARLAFEAGYADQAHLTRECRRLGGLPPAALLAAGVGSGGESPDALAEDAWPAVAAA